MEIQLEIEIYIQFYGGCTTMFLRSENTWTKSFLTKTVVLLKKFKTPCFAPPYL